jgi:hypothetical protein
MATKYQYNEEAHNSNWPLYTPGNVWGAQTFEHTAAISSTYVELKMHRSGSGGNVTVSIRAVDGSNHPTGGDLAVSNAVDCTGITTSSTGEWVTFTFTSPTPTLAADTTYAIVARGDTAIANTVRWEVDTSSPSYANGNFVTSSDSGSSWTTQSWDGIFRVWGEAVVADEYAEGTKTVTAAASVELASENYVDKQGPTPDRPSDYDPDGFWDEDTGTWTSTRTTHPGNWSQNLLTISEEGEIYFRTI